MWRQGQPVLRQTVSPRTVQTICVAGLHMSPTACAVTGAVILAGPATVARKILFI
jgi:hypothetical protein